MRRPTRNERRLRHRAHRPPVRPVRHADRRATHSTVRAIASAGLVPAAALLRAGARAAGGAGLQRRGRARLDDDARLPSRGCGSTTFPRPRSGTTWRATSGWRTPPTDPFSFGLPYFNATDYSMVTDSPTLPQVQRDNLWQVSDSFSLLRGRHTLKFGGDWLHFQIELPAKQPDARAVYLHRRVHQPGWLRHRIGGSVRRFSAWISADHRRAPAAPARLTCGRMCTPGYVQDDWRVDAAPDREAGQCGTNMRRPIRKRAATC